MFLSLPHLYPSLDGWRRDAGLQAPLLAWLDPIVVRSVDSSGLTLRSLEGPVGTAQDRPKRKPPTTVSHGWQSGRRRGRSGRVLSARELDSAFRGSDVLGHK